eukprot:GHVT01076813.1.p1 GENE.GHVT01076813.1~~GHVT01076813.1.p1  ORF type:complete len:204 (-),score=52.69 GHVT01076813.1:1907-2518(-)
MEDAQPSPRQMEGHAGGQAQAHTEADGREDNREEQALSLATAREERKRAALDAQLLANRIALLKQEEAKALKKIKEAKARTQNISEMRRKHQAKFTEKEELQRQRQEEVAKAQLLNATQRAEDIRKRQLALTQLLESRRTEVAVTKSHSQEIRQVKKEREETETIINKQKSTSIRKDREGVKMKIDSLKVRTIHLTSIQVQHA